MDGDMSYLETVGKTPLVRLKNSLPEEAKVRAVDRVDFPTRNSSYSVDTTKGMLASPDVLLPSFLERASLGKQTLARSGALAPLLG